MKKKITINHKEYTMPKLSIDNYMEYLKLEEEIDTHRRYTGQDIANMCTFVCKVYGNQFTEAELKDPETGLDPAGLIMEFQGIDMDTAQEIEKRLERITKNLSTAS